MVPPQGRDGWAVVAYARQFLGNPYVYGGNSLTDGIDCSGFTQQIYAAFGVSLGRTDTAQASAGVEIPLSQAQAGDLVVYYGPVGLYNGSPFCAIRPEEFRTCFSPYIAFCVFIQYNGGVF